MSYFIQPKVKNLKNIHIDAFNLSIHSLPLITNQVLVAADMVWYFRCPSPLQPFSSSSLVILRRSQER